jgi:CheY-like chemotaxis protein
MLVRLNGHDSVSAYSGEEALSTASDFRPDVLVTDYSMPGMNGFQLATCIAQQYPGCRLFLLTADLDVSRFLPTPCRPNVTVLQKPLPPNDLLAAIAHPEIKLQPNSPVLLTVDDVEAHRYSVSRLFNTRGLHRHRSKNWGRNT